MTGAVLLAVATAGVLVAAVCAATLLRLRDPLEWLVAVGLLAVAGIVLVSLVAGALLRRYEPTALIAVAGVVDAVLVVALARARPRSARAADVLDAVRRTLAELTAWQWTLVVLAALALGWRFLLALVLPPFAYDGLTYHLTIVAEWIQRGRIVPNPYAECCARYPSNAETLFGWPTVFLDHDLLADMPQVLLAALGAAAVAGLARWAGVRAGDAVTAGALFLLTPIVLTQANTTYNDLAVASMLLVALFFVTRFLGARPFAFGHVPETPRTSYALLCGLAAGFVLGAKSSGVAIAAIIGGLVLAHLGVALARRRITAGTAVRTGLAFVAAVPVLGGWWYGRNWIETGNPVWPFAVKPLGAELFAGPATVSEYLTIPPGGERYWLVEVARSWFHDLTFWTATDYSYEQRDGGLGPLWSWLGWGALAVFGVWAVRRRPDVAVNLILPLAAIYAVLPYRWWSRFTIFLAALGAVALVTVLARLRRGPARAAVIAAVLVLAACGVARATWWLDPAGLGSRLSMVKVARVAAQPASERTVGELFYPEYRWLSDVPADATILVETEAPSIRFVYPLFGASLDRRIVQLLPTERPSVETLLPATGPVYVAVERGGRFDAQAARLGGLAIVFERRGVRVYGREPA